MPNRLLLADRVGQAVASAMRQGHLVAIAYLDLDGFKAVNDTYGHEAGDQLLKEIARRVVGDVRAGDTVARIGGDEFVLVLGGLADVSQCNPVLERILNSIAQPVRVKGALKHRSREALAWQLLRPMERSRATSWRQQTEPCTTPSVPARGESFMFLHPSNNQI